MKKSSRYQRRSDPMSRPKNVHRAMSDEERSFLSKTAIDPFPQIIFEKGSSDISLRMIDLICPVGMGQRGLIVAPPGAGKTTLLKNICQSVSKAYPGIRPYCLLIDERPEEVTDFRRHVNANIRSSTSDQPYEHHVSIANELMREVIQNVNKGMNILVLIDSLTRLSRVHNAERRSSGRTLSGGVDARAMEVPRRMFGAARNIEDGGSLTILATILVDTGSRMDEVIFEEFKGTGNMEIVLSRDLAAQRIFPAMDIAKSGTRKEELLVKAGDLEKMRAIRRSLLESGPVKATEALIDQMKRFSSNREVLETFM